MANRRALAWLKPTNKASTTTASNGRIGSGQCSPSWNQKRRSSKARRASWNSAWLGYISSHPSHPGGEQSNGLGRVRSVVPTDALRGRHDAGKARAQLGARADPKLPVDPRQVGADSVHADQELG